MFELSPLWRSVLVLLLLLSSYFVMFGCACSEWPPGLGYFNIYSIFLSSPPPDGLSSGTESNLPVNHPPQGIQIVDYVEHTHVCGQLWSKTTGLAHRREKQKHGPMHESCCHCSAPDTDHTPFGTAHAFSATNDLG